MNMESTIANSISEIQRYRMTPTMESVSEMQNVMRNLSQDQEVRSRLKADIKKLPTGNELFRSDQAGSVLMAYQEIQNQYRSPHDHGDAWVIYAVVSGEMDMGNYVKLTQPDSSFRLILKSRETLFAGDTRIYFPGEIHDTRCASKDAVILRFTSSDLKIEERLGRMRRYQL
jgi:hypothetical protein